MPRPILLEKVLTRARIVEELQAIEDEVSGQRISLAGAVRLRDLRLAIDTKPMDIDPQ